MDRITYERHICGWERLPPSEIGGGEVQRGDIYYTHPLISKTWWSRKDLDKPIFKGARNLISDIFPEDFI